MILVVGATGALGSEICRRLRARGLEVRGLVRPGSARASELRGIGVEISSGDLRSRAAIEAACKGVSSVISTATAMGSKDKSLTLRAIDRDAQRNVVEIAAKSGVKQFIYVSLAGHLLSSAPLVRYKREIESAVRASGMRWTIFQPTAFMEIWLGKQLGWDFAEGRATMVGDGTGTMSWISLGDVAEHCVRALDDPRLANRDVPLGGPEALSPSDVLRIVEQVSKRKYKVTHVNRTMLRVLGPVIGLFNEGAASGMSLFVQSAISEHLDLSLQRELALPLMTVQEYATRMVRPIGT